MPNSARRRLEGLKVGGYPTTAARGARIKLAMQNQGRENEMLLTAAGGAAKKATWAYLATTVGDQPKVRIDADRIELGAATRLHQLRY